MTNYLAIAALVIAWHFPAYPSGHATFGAAAFHITRLFYGVSAGDRARDDLFKDLMANDLDFVSDEFNGITTDNKGAVRPKHLRNFADGLWQMIEENGRSRIDLGVHWVFDAFVVKDDGTPDLARTDAAGNHSGESRWIFRSQKTSSRPAVGRHS